MIGEEECVIQHKLLVCQINLRTKIKKQHKPPPKRCIWKSHKPEDQEKYKKAVEESINSSALLSHPDSEADSESIWAEIKSCLINSCDSVCGWTKGNGKQERKTGRWDETVESLVKQMKTIEGVTEKRQQRKIFGGKRERKIRCICY